ncbi:MAG: hypothetical protein ACPGUX_02465 [Halocynthiibacter sp.]
MGYEYTLRTNRPEKLYRFLEAELKSDTGVSGDLPIRLYSNPKSNGRGDDFDLQIAKVGVNIVLLFRRTHECTAKLATNALAIAFRNGVLLDILDDDGDSRLSDFF